MRVNVLHSVEEKKGNCSIAFQFCEYPDKEYGYRFIWKNQEGKLMAHRGQARIPDLETIYQLKTKAAKAGWLGICER